MTLSNVRATLGLNATATLGAAGTSGSISLGQNNQTINLTGAVQAYSSQIIFANSGDTTTLNLGLNAHSGTTTWVAGVAQVETATAAGTVTASGSAEIIVTAAGMTGSPKTLAVAVATSDTPTLWAAKVRSALTADSAVSAMFTVSGTTTAIILTRKPTHTFTVPGGTIGIKAANDTTLNIALATGTATGITTASTSANTTSGVASDGALIYDGDGKDLEGSPINFLYVHGLSISNESVLSINADGNGTDFMKIGSGETRVMASVNGLAVDASYILTASAAASVLITVFGG